MSNQTVTKDSITVHGRGSLVLSFSLNDEQEQPQDISGWELFFEVDGVPIREALVPDPVNPLGQRIVLERQQVELLSKSPRSFAVIDERLADEDIYTVLWEGKISRTAYKNSPDTVVDA